MDWLDWLREHAWETWLGAAVLLGVAEVVSLDMVLVMLATGALVGSLTALIGGPVAMQIIFAMITSVAMLAVVRPGVVRRLHRGPELKTGAAALIGSQAMVLEPLTAHAPGRVKIGGEVWTAQPYDEDAHIEAGAVVDVVQIQGATAYVLRTAQLESGLDGV